MCQVCVDPYEEYSRLKKKLDIIENTMKSVKEECQDNPCTETECFLKNLEFEFCDLINEIIEFESVLNHHLDHDGFFVDSTK